MKLCRSRLDGGGNEGGESRPDQGTSPFPPGSTIPTPKIAAVGAPRGDALPSH